MFDFCYLYEIATQKVIYGRHAGDRLVASGKYRDATQQEIDAFNLQKEKDKYYPSRNEYLQCTYCDWFDDLENIPTDVSTNRTTCKNQKASIKACTTIAELTALGLDKDITF